MSKKEKDGNWFIRHKILTVIGVIIVIAIIASAAGGGAKKNNTTTASSSSSNTSTSKTATTAGLNQPADDGKFEFTATAFKCGIPSVSDSTGYLSKSAQGQYCELTVTVKNIGTQAQIFDGSSQYLLNGSSKYTYDSTATIYANPSDSTFLNTINPGNTASGTIVFDVPQGVTPTMAELHDSSLSNGVKITLQ